MTQTNPAEHLARNLDWNLIRTFAVLAESNSVTDAAERLRLKQPTVSNALKRLEDRLGKRLINRAPGRFQLTEAGHLLYREAVDIHGAILRLDTIMRDVTDEVQGHVRIALASGVTCPLFDDVLRDFHEDYPKATLSLEVSASEDALAAVLGRRVSFALCLVRKRSPKLEYLRLYREYFGLFCGPSHPLFGRNDIAKSELTGQSAVSFITDQMSDALRSVTLMRAEAELDERIVGKSANLEEVRRMIVAGMGIGPLPVHVVKRDVEDGLLWRLPPYKDLPAIDVYVVWNPSARMNRAEEAMLDKLRTRIETTPVEDRTYV